MYWICTNQQHLLCPSQCPLLSASDLHVSPLQLCSTEDSSIKDVCIGRGLSRLWKTKVDKGRKDLMVYGGLHLVHRQNEAYRVSNWCISARQSTSDRRVKALWTETSWATSTKICCSLWQPLAEDSKQQFEEDSNCCRNVTQNLVSYLRLFSSKIL